jgi:hypothetical protein
MTRICKHRGVVVITASAALTVFLLGSAPPAHAHGGGGGGGGGHGGCGGHSSCGGHSIGGGHSSIGSHGCGVSIGHSSACGTVRSSTCVAGVHDSGVHSASSVAARAAVTASTSSRHTLTFSSTALSNPMMMQTDSSVLSDVSSNPNEEPKVKHRGMFHHLHNLFGGSSRQPVDQLSVQPTGQPAEQSADQSSEQSSMINVE